jgi:hypothetical protein
MNVPFDGSYWVVPGKFLAGCYPGAKRLDEAGRKLAALLDAGIRCVVSLMEEDVTDWSGDGFEGYQEDIGILAEERGLQVECLRMPIPNTSIPTFGTMRRILDEIDGAINRGKPVYVHCWGGKGRAGTVVGCWLMRHGIATADGVLPMIQELRKDDPAWFEPSPENERQRWMVKSWKAGE